MALFSSHVFLVNDDVKGVMLIFRLQEFIINRQKSNFSKSSEMICVSGLRANIALWLSYHEDHEGHEKMQ